MSAAPSSELLARLFGSAEMTELFGDRARLQGMLEFEAALARAEARVGVIPNQAAAPIGNRCRAELFDVESLAEATARAGNPAIPMVKALIGLVAADDSKAARYVHFGATSQDAMDTGLVLQLRRFCSLLEADLDRLSAALARVAEAHKTTPLVGRTLLQHASPVTLGLKAAGWLDAVERHRTRLAEVRTRALVLQLGGAAGTLAALGHRGLEVARALSDELNLALPLVPWHAHRDRFAELATFLGLLIGTLGKISRDLSLLMQTEVAEAFEPEGEGRGGSSTMPHKRNPLTAAVVLAAGALRQTAETIDGLELDPARMRANLDATQGQIMAEALMVALLPHIGRLQAHEIVERGSRRAAETGRHLKAVLAEEPAVTQHLSPADLDALFEPLNYLGQATAFVDRVLGARRRKKEGP